MVKLLKITYPHFDHNYSKYSFRCSLNQNLQCTKEFENKIKFYWLNFITSLSFLWLNKVLIIISSLIQLTIAYHALSVSFNRVSYCVKSVRIRSFSGPHFPVFSPNAGKYGPEKLRIRTLFTQWVLSWISKILPQTNFSQSITYHQQN